MYHWFLRQDRRLCFVAEINSVLIGFAVGTYKSGRSIKDLMSFVPTLLGHGSSAVLSLKPSSVVRILKRLLERSDTGPIDVDSVCLRSIAVAPTARRTGAGSLLLRAFENSALHLKAAKVALTTDETNNGATLKFYEKNGYSVAHKFKQDGIRSMVQMVKYLAA
jgi:ribosomal protein S18 acetylase RimI-like enzyme